MTHDPNRLIVTLTVSELEALMEQAAERGARRIARELQDPLLKTSEIAERLRCQVSTINAAVARGELVPEKRSRSGGRGKGHLIRLSEGMRWLSTKGRGETR